MLCPVELSHSNGYGGKLKWLKSDWKSGYNVRNGMSEQELFRLLKRRQGIRTVLLLVAWRGFVFFPDAGKDF